MQIFLVGGDSQLLEEAAMRHRHRGNSKIKYEHGMIQGLRDLLESIEHWPEITSIIPARINPTRASGKGFRFEVKYQTPSGLKALAKTGASVQEVFLVTHQPDALERRLKCSLQHGNAR